LEERRKWSVDREIHVANGDATGFSGGRAAGTVDAALPGIEDLRCRGQKRATDVRQGDLPGCSNEEWRADFTFERRNRPAQGRLADMQRAGGTIEVKGSGQR
jgi:hypothetical protein